MRAACRCPRCRENVVPEGPSASARAALVVAALLVVMMCVLAPYLGFLLFAVAPVVAAAGLGLGPLVAAATAPVTCPSCFRRLEPEPRALAIQTKLVDARAP
jgi:hypothetical protein